jgi:hypothetical protein
MFGSVIPSGGSIPSGLTKDIRPFGFGPQPATDTKAPSFLKLLWNFSVWRPIRDTVDVA